MQKSDAHHQFMLTGQPDLQGPAPRKSFAESDLQKLPRSFSVSMKDKGAPSTGTQPPSDEDPNQSSSISEAEQEPEPAHSAYREHMQYEEQLESKGLEAQVMQEHTQQQDALQFSQSVTLAGSSTHSSASREVQPVGLASSQGHGEAGSAALRGTDGSSEQPPAPATEGTELLDSSAAVPDELEARQQPLTEPDLAPPAEPAVMPPLPGGADLSYIELTALLGSAEMAEDDDLSELGNLSAASSPHRDHPDVSDAALNAAVGRAEAAAADLPELPGDDMAADIAADAELAAMAAAQAQQADFLLPYQQHSSAGDADLADTLEQARDEQRLDCISDEHAAKDLASDMQRLATLTGRQGGPITDAEHESHMRRLAELTGGCTV